MNVFRATLLSIALVACTARIASSQVPHLAGERSLSVDHLAAPFLSPDHWAVHVLDRLDALGLISDYLPSQRGVQRGVVAAHLWEATRRVDDVAPELRQLVFGWYDRFLDEFPEYSDHARREMETGARVNFVLDVQYHRISGVTEPGRRISGKWSGAIPLADLHAPAFGGDVSIVGSRFGVAASATIQENEIKVPLWSVIVPLGRIGVSVGRETIAYGSAVGGNVVLSGITPQTGVQVFTREPFRLPGHLQHIGLISAHTFVSRFVETRHPGDPWFWGAALSIQPHPRLTLTGIRASIFGGDSVGVPVTVRSILEMLRGETKRDTNAFDNQNASVEVRFRPPTEDFLPLLVHIEAGMEDIDVVRGLRDSPGVVVGVTILSPPWLPGVQVGVERASFAKRCCGNGTWYRHPVHRGGWAVEEGPLGHPVGGHGTETLIFGRYDQQRLSLRVQAFRRSRGEENLYAPNRIGRSNGGMVRLQWRLHPGMELSVSGYGEDGLDWDEYRLMLGMRIRY